MNIGMSYMFRDRRLNYMRLRRLSDENKKRATNRDSNAILSYRPRLCLSSDLCH